MIKVEEAVNFYPLVKPRFRPSHLRVDLELGTFLTVRAALGGSESRVLEAEAIETPEEEGIKLATAGSVEHLGEGCSVTPVDVVHVEIVFSLAHVPRRTVEIAE
jgi:hypothetical protein